jgi:hypothetical protein
MLIYVIDFMFLVVLNIQWSSEKNPIFGKQKWFAFVKAFIFSSLHLIILKN